MRITARQMHVFGADADRRLCDRLAAAAMPPYGQARGWRSPADAAPVIEFGISRARAFDFTTDQEIAAFVFGCLAVGEPALTATGAFLEVACSPARDPAEKADMLLHAVDEAGGQARVTG